MPILGIKLGLLYSCIQVICSIPFSHLSDPLKLNVIRIDLESFFVYFQHNDSEEDMFGDYDSFAENSILAQFDDLEQKHMQISDHRTHDLDVTAEKFHSEDIKRNKFSVLAGSNLLEERIDDSLRDSQIGNGEVSEESEINVLFDMPSSQLLYFENLNHAPDTLDNQTAATEQVRIPSCQKADKEELPHTSTEQPPEINDSSYAQPSSDVNRRKSLKERLKTAMTSNARVQTPAFSKTKQLKETLLNEEINVAKKTIELSSDDLGPFYSLPSKVRSLYVQFKGIEKLYGNALLLG